MLDDTKIKLRELFEQLYDEEEDKDKISQIFDKIYEALFTWHDDFGFHDECKDIIGDIVDLAYDVAYHQ